MKKAGLLLLIIVLSLVLVQASQLKVTEEHPFLINNKWISAKDLQVGDLLTTIDGKKAKITSIQDVEGKNPFLVYNLEDNIFHNYAASGIIVHNSNNPGILGKLSQAAKKFWADESGELRIPFSRKIGVKYSWEGPYVQYINGEKTLVFEVGYRSQPDFNKLFVIQKGEKVKLFRFIDFISEDAVKLLNGCEGNEIRYSRWLSEANGNLDTVIARLKTQWGLANIDYLLTQTHRTGGPGASTSLNGAHLDSPIHGEVRLVLEMEIPSEYLVASSGPPISPVFDINNPDIVKYGFVAYDLFEGEITFPFKIPAEYLKEVRVYVTNPRLRSIFANNPTIKSIDVANGIDGRLSEPQIREIRGW